MEQFEHTVIFNEEINHETVQDLIDKLSSHNFVNLYFSTDGGQLSDMEVLIEYLNYRHATTSLRLHLNGYVASAGVLMLTHYTGPIFIGKSFYAFVFHAPDITINTIRKTGFEDGAKKVLGARNRKFFQDWKNIGLTTKEIKDIEEGKDIYIFAYDLGRIKRPLFSGVEEEVTQTYLEYKF